MDIEKIKNIRKVLVKTQDYCDRKPLRECNPFDCILNKGCKRGCVARNLRYINFTLREL